MRYTKWSTAIFSVLQHANLGSWLTTGVGTLDRSSTLTLAFLFTTLQVPVVAHLKPHAHTNNNSIRLKTLLCGTSPPTLLTEVSIFSPIKYDYGQPEAALTHRVIRSTGVHASTFFEGHALVIAEDEAWVTLTALHTYVLTARWADHTHARFRTGTHAQRVGAVGRTV